MRRTTTEAAFLVARADPAAYINRARAPGSIADRNSPPWPVSLLNRAGSATDRSPDPDREPGAKPVPPS